MATYPQRREMIVFYFIRKNFEVVEQRLVPSELKYIIQQFAMNLIESEIISMQQQSKFIDLLRNNIKDIDDKKFILLYRASQNEYSASKFHELCDNYTPTLTIIKTNYGAICGGYTTKKWNCIGSKYRSDKNAFLFRFDHKKGINSKIYNRLHAGNRGFNRKRAIYCKRDLGPTFGEGHDLTICNKSNQWHGDKNRRWNCWTYPKATYNHKNDICGGSKTDSVGAMLFATIEYEVFHLQ